MMSILGVPPHEIYSDWLSYFDGCEDRLLKVYEPACSLAETVRTGFTESSGLSSFAEGAEIETLCHLVVSILVYDPSQRPTIEEVMQHPAMEFLDSVEGN